MALSPDVHTSHLCLNGRPDSMVNHLIPWSIFLSYCRIKTLNSHLLGLKKKVILRKASALGI